MSMRRAKDGEDCAVERSGGGRGVDVDIDGMIS